MIGYLTTSEMKIKETSVQVIFGLYSRMGVQVQTLHVGDGQNFPRDGDIGLGFKATVHSKNEWILKNPIQK